MSQIYNIPSSCCFVDCLAQKLLNDCSGNQLTLADIIILLPNHRACRSLADAFVKIQGMKPTILPQMRAIGDVDEDEILLGTANQSALLSELPAAITPLERTLLLAKLIMSRYREFGLENISFSQSCQLAQQLGILLDNVALRNLDWQNLQNIVPDEYAAHWQETLNFLKIITKYWPDILSERSVIDIATHRNRLLQQQCRTWQEFPPQQKIIIAGTTAVSPIMKELVQTVLNLPDSEIYLSGLDKFLDDESWDCIDESHPQFEIKQLLDFLKISRNNIPNLIPPHNLMREQLISEIMRPSICTDKWHHINSYIDASALSGIHLMECNNIREEALSIALLIRHEIEKPSQTVALVTPDRNLARRVCSELQRWDINVDDSAGIPLNQTSWGIFIRLVAKVAANSGDKNQFLSLLKNHLMSQYVDTPTCRQIAERIDKIIWRSQQSDNIANEFLNQITSVLQPLFDLFAKETINFNAILQHHIKICEILSSTPDKKIDMPLWRGDDGKIGADFIAELLQKSSLIDDIAPKDYIEILETLMSNIMVRSTSRSHPRIKILGPIEARLNHYDTIIIGECIEGIWPQSPQADPWMSRPMKRQFGLNQPEQQIGVTALDLSNLLGAKNIYLTRSQTNDGAQTVKSRWWMRLITVVQALNLPTTSLYDQYFTKLSNLIDTPAPDEITKISPPAPTPPLEARPRKFSASAIEKLMRDPYGVFAEYILKLKPLDDLEHQPDQSDFGNLVHSVLEKFTKLYPHQLPQNANEILNSLGNDAFAEANFPPDKIAFWLPKFQQIIKWFISVESDYRQQISQTQSETWGCSSYNIQSAGEFEIYAKADRIDCTIDGKYNIIDYKTGRARSAKEVKTGYAPQLPLEAIIANNGGFTGLPSAKINQLMYWKLGDKIINIDTDIDKLLTNTEQHLFDIITRFSDPDTGYISRPNPKHVPEYSDYEHLARVKEWSVKDEGEDN